MNVKQRYAIFFVALLVLGLVRMTQAQETPDAPPAAPTETVPADAPPKINTFPGGYEVIFSRPTSVTGFAIRSPLAGDYEMAFDTTPAMLDTPPKPVEDIAILIVLADYWIVRGKPTHAAGLYRRGLDIEPNNLLLQNNLALILSSAEGKHDAALQLINAALQERPEHVTLLDTKGLIMMNGGHYDQAVPIFERCVELSCQGPLYVLHLAYALDQLGGQDQRARDWFDKVKPKLDAAAGTLLKENKAMYDTLQQKYGNTADSTIR